MSHKRWSGIGSLVVVVALVSATQIGCGGGGGHQTSTGGAAGSMIGGPGGSTTGSAGAGGAIGPTTGIALLVDAPTVTVMEGDATGASFHVTLSGKSKTPITVNVASGDRTIATTQEDTLVFPANSVGPLTVTVLGTEDSDLINNTTIVTLTSTDAVAASVKVQVTDNDAQTLIVTPKAVSMTEGNQTQLEVRLGFAPTAPVMVMVASDTAAKLAVSPATLTFNGSNFSIPQQVMLNALPDGDTADDMATVTFTGPGAGGFPPVSVPVSIVDKDVLNINVQPASLSLSEATMAPGTLMVSLTQAPPGQLTVTVMPSNEAKAGVSLPALAFTAANFSTPQAIAVTPKQDDDFKDENITINFAATGVTPRSAAVTIKDDDSQSLMVNPAVVLVTEGASTTFSVRLAYDPGSPASVNAFSSNTSKVTVSPAILMFDSTNFAVPQQITVQGQQDDDLVDEMANVILTAGGANSVTVPVTELDDDKQAIKLVYSTAPGILQMQETQAGGIVSTAQLGVSLAFRPAANVQVTLASSDTTKLSLSRATLTFGPADYAVTQFVTLTAPHDNDLSDDNVIIHLDGTGVGAPIDLPVEIIDLDVQNFVISPIPDTMDEGTTAMFTVRLAFDAAADINVAITSSNATAVSNVLTATSAPSPCHLKLASEMCAVTLNAMADPTADDGMATITVADAVSVVRPRTAVVKIHDLNVQALVVTPAHNPLVVSENGMMTDSFTVRLGAQPPGMPTDPFAFTFTPSVAGAVTISPSGPLTVGTATTGITVTVVGTNDDLLRDILLSIQVSAPSSLGLADKFVNVTKTNDDQQGLVLSNPPCGLNTLELPPGGIYAPGTTTPAGGLMAGSPLTVPEEGADDMQFCVRLAAQPDQTTTVTLTPGQAPKAIAVADKNFQLATTVGMFSTSPATLSFGTMDYNTSKPVWVHVPDDRNLDDDDGTITISVTPFANPRIIYLKLTDNDRPQGIQLRAGGTLISDTPAVVLTEGAAATNNVSLAVTLKNTPLKVSASDSTTSEILTISSPDCASRLTFNTTTMTFSDVTFDAAQTLTVTTATDEDTVSDSCHVNIASNRAGTAMRSLALTINDPDMLDVVFTNGSGVDLALPPTFNVSENATATFGIRFTKNPMTAAHAAPSVSVGIGTFSTAPWSQMTFSTPVPFTADISASWSNVKLINFTAGGSDQCRASVVVPVVVSGWGGSKTLSVDTKDDVGPSCSIVTAR